MFERYAARFEGIVKRGTRAAPRKNPMMNTPLRDCIWYETPWMNPLIPKPRRDLSVDPYKYRLPKYSG